MKAKMIKFFKLFSSRIFYLVLGLFLAASTSVYAALTWDAQWPATTGETITATMLNAIKDNINSVDLSLTNLKNATDCGTNKVMTGIDNNGNMTCIDANSFSDVTCDWVGWRSSYAGITCTGSCWNSCGNTWAQTCSSNVSGLKINCLGGKAIQMQAENVCSACACPADPYYCFII